MNQVIKRSINSSQIKQLFSKWFNKHYRLEHTSIGYIGMFGVWDVMGKNELDQQFFISGRTEHLIQMRDYLNEAIDEAIAVRQENSV
ncbi:MAG: hypothetical protein EA364_05495 [Balneolaceae bacterium]|nr:MAG: hypothetical protein EA364_05495 [Balneolaceae bacterium]